MDFKEYFTMLKFIIKKTLIICHRGGEVVIWLKYTIIIL